LEEYNLVDLWLNIPDADVPRVVDSGLAAVREETLECGVPLGMFVLGEAIDAMLEGNPNCKLVLCKVALGRSLPTTCGTLHACPDAALPAGYHSLCLIVDGEGVPAEEAASLAEDRGIPLDHFKHNYIVPNAALVLPTHYASFNIEDSEALAPPNPT
jgi:hypothetical protein